MTKTQAEEAPILEAASSGMKQNHDRVMESLLEGFRCAQCTWCAEIAWRRKRRFSFCMGAVVGATLLLAFLAIIRA